ncbi:MAG: fibronectin type III domain-containing protein [Dehalococcoidia bacterium]|nr:fibronectin type III domain-containing protein [Dehalococcoidia bacterium]
MKWLSNCVVIALSLALVLGSAGCGVKDTFPPDAPTGIAATTDCNDNTPSFSWDAAADKGSGVDYYLVAVDSGDWIDAGDSTDYTLATAIPDGDHVFNLKAVDKAGNEGIQGSLAFTIDTGASTISGVVVSITSSSTATIAWTTNESTTSQVEYGTTTSYGSSSTLDSNLVTTHSVGLTGLSSCTTYHYRVRSKDACGNEAISQDYTFAEGQLPVIKIGDKWTFEEVMDSVYYSCIYEVTGEGKVGDQDCWIMEFSYSPSFLGISEGSQRVSKATWDILQLQTSMTWEGMSATAAGVCLYVPSGTSLFPLKVGSQFTRTETLTMTVTVLGETETTTDTQVHTYKVQGVEEITVQAGTFVCFKITDTVGTRVSTLWYSDKAKTFVKEIAADGSTTELKSYLV